ncbi:hypothetical protein ACE01N_18745 [Saccharicrinis sp. FJH2]|uniref:hypothetical protein n=1 Tax=unclassified Saccharicrinis TaxID=2646859 RepID=UPI0035D46314
MNHKYIVENLCEQRDLEVNTCNGCCHLKKEIKKVAPEPEKTDKSTPANRISIKLRFNDYISVIKWTRPDQPADDYDFNKSKDLYSYLYPSSCFHPPEAIIS